MGQLHRQVSPGNDSQIASRLGISAKTADRHTQRAYRKLCVSSRAGATLFAMEHGPGGGQAGLPVGYHLAQRDLPCMILDGGHEIGEVWRAGDSLRLFTPARIDGLDGMRFPGRSNPHSGRSRDGGSSSTGRSAAHVGTRLVRCTSSAS